MGRFGPQAGDFVQMKLPMKNSNLLTAYDTQRHKTVSLMKNGTVTKSPAVLPFNGAQLP